MSALTSTSSCTTCPYCGVGCGVKTEINAEQKIVQVSGDTEHPANLGRLCVKGSSLHETLDTHGRLLKPSINGEDVSWDKALDTVADKFAESITKYGPDSVAFYLSGQILTEDYYVANKIMKGYVGSANVDTNSRLCMASAVIGYKRAFGSDTVPCNYQDLEICDLLVLIGSNAAWAHPVLFQRIEAAKKARPNMKVVLIDPRRTTSADIADLHLPVLPGSDAFLFNGLLRYLADHDALDSAYISEYTEGFAEAIAATEDATLEATSKACGVDLKALETFYQWFSNTDKSISFYSMGINQSSSGSDKCNAIINCHLASGKIGKPGAGPFSITGQPNAMGGREVGGLANQLAAHMGFVPEQIDLVKRFWNAPNMATKPGLLAVDLFKAVEAGKIKALWIMGTNPAVSMPDADRVRDAIQQCEFVVVSECVEKTDTSQCANVLLPATTWGEKNGTVTNSERRISRQRGIMPAPGDAQHDWLTLTQFAQKLGARLDWPNDAFAYQHPRDIFIEHAALSHFENNGSRDFDISGLANLTIEQYDALDPIQWPVNSQYPNGRQRMFDDNKFYTPSGKAQFILINSALPVTKPSQPYPFVMNTGRIRDQWHTMTRTGKAPRLLNHKSNAYVSINPKTMAEKGIENGDLCQLTSPTGVMLALAEADTGLRKNQLFTPIHWNDQFAKLGRSGALIASHVDPVSGQPESKATPVNISLQPVHHWVSFISANEINTATFDYWSSTPIPQGYRYLVAMYQDFNWSDWVAKQGLASAISYQDATCSDLRMLCVDSTTQRPSLLLFVSSTHQNLPELSWMAEQMQHSLPNNPAAQYSLLAGRPAAGMDKGALICSCFEVGEIQIIDAINAGATDTKTLGKQLKCGTNCGSCLPELRALIHQHG